MLSEFIEDVAETVFQMMKRGHHDPSIEEIIEKHDGPVTEATNIYFWKEQLPKVRDVLAGQPMTATAHMVSPVYYDTDEIKDLATARRCAATSCRGAGLRIAKTSDLIWQAVQEHNVKSGGMKTAYGMERAWQSHKMNVITTQQLKEIIDAAIPFLNAFQKCEEALRDAGLSRMPLFDPPNDEK